jgi:transcriptional regulator with XRE-family HTH domain
MPLSSAVKLAETLAQRVAQLREFRNMTVRDLAKASRFGLRRIEDIESGLETWFSATERQLLARALSVEPALLQEVERRPNRSSVNDMEVAAAVLQDLSKAILNGARDLECPLCSSTLKCSIQEGIDMEERPISFAKAFCTKCPFILR